MKRLLCAMLIFSYHIINAQQIRIGSYNYNIIAPKIRDYSSIYTKIGNQMDLQYSELPNTFRFHSKYLKTSLYNIENLQEIYVTESKTETTIYIDFNTNSLAFETNNEFPVYNFTLVQSKSCDAEGIIPNIGRFAITQYGENNYIIMLFLRSSGSAYCTVKSYNAIMTGCKK